jgi:hypothetical protein
MTDKFVQSELFEDVDVTINWPYNTPIERIKDTSVFEVQIFKRNGEKPFIKVRYPKNETKAQ